MTFLALGNAQTSLALLSLNRKVLALASDQRSSEIVKLLIVKSYLSARVINTYIRGFRMCVKYSF